MSEPTVSAVSAESADQAGLQAAACALRETLEPLLLDLFDEAARVQADGTAAVLMDYHAHVAELGRVARQQGLTGLGYACMLVESGVIRLVALSAGAALEDRLALAEWPGHVLMELIGPPAEGAMEAVSVDEALAEDSAASTGPRTWLTLHALRSHDWFPAVNAQHIELVERRLGQDHARLHPRASASLRDLVPAVPNGVVDLDLPLDAHAIGWSAAPMACVEAEIGWHDATSSGGAADEPLDPAAELHADELTDELTDESAATPPADGEVTLEELAMLAEACAGLRDDIAQALSAASPDGALTTALAAQTESLHNLANAATLVGLTGLRQLLDVALVNTAALLDMPCTHAPLALLLSWPGLAIDHLQAPADAAAAQALVACFMDEAWPLPIEPEAAASCLVELGAVRVLRARVDASRPARALPEHIDLAVPADIDRKVLDSLLQELPAHAQAFSVLVQRLAEGGTLEEAEEARRVAHTLKGAANTVGIKGVANLTHALEDILVAFGREACLPPAPVCAVLLEASDCLEAMSEALLAGGPPPEEALAVHQTVLDWANRIDREGVLAAAQPAASSPLALPFPPSAPMAAEPARASSSPCAIGHDGKDPSGDSGHSDHSDHSDPRDDNGETYLRVPVSLIDSLLRLAGEHSVLTSQIQDRVKHLGDHLHALRTGSRHAGQLSAELEQLVDVRGLAMLGGHAGELDALEMDQYNELHMLSRRIVESGADSREFARAFEREVTGLRDLVAEKERLQLALQRTIERARMVEVASIVPRLQRTVRQAARVLGRGVSLQVEGAQTLVDTQLLDRLLDPLMHLLRNAVDHGIEPADTRVARGKPAQGRITLRFASQGNGVAIQCEDDGAGMDLAAIRRRAEAVGLVPPGAVLADADVMRLILVPGFSTRTQTTQLSGRGIGMDVVQRTVLDLRGSLEMSAGAGQGSRFDLHFPVGMSTVQVLLSRADTHLLALSVRGVEQILPAREEVEIAADGSLRYLMQGERLPAVRLERLLDLPAESLRKPGVIEVAMIVRDAARQRRAIIVPELQESRMVVVKPFHAGMPRVLGVDGATVLGDGAVASVLDLPDLLRGFEAAGQPAMPQALMPDEAETARAPLCLVVDDSVSVRRTMEQLMHDSGYEVVTARDGVDALGLVQHRAPDIVLVDLEMPRMNGLELTSALRNRQATRATPVVMITSRFTDRHRQLADDAGVDAFLTKPYSEDLLLHTMDDLLRRAA